MLVRMQRNGIIHTLLVGMQNGTTLKNSLVISLKTKLQLPHNPATVPRHLFQRNENYVHAKPCAQMFGAAPFVITPKMETIQTYSNRLKNGSIHLGIQQ